MNEPATAELWQEPAERLSHNEKFAPFGRGAGRRTAALELSMFALPDEDEPWPPQQSVPPRRRRKMTLSAGGSGDG
jgi:hypothetical protein